jgi:hypothetical protein
MVQQFYKNILAFYYKSYATLRFLFNISGSWLYKFSFSYKPEGQTTVKISNSLKKQVTRKEILL